MVGQHLVNLDSLALPSLPAALKWGMFLAALPFSTITKAQDNSPAFVEVAIKNIETMYNSKIAQLPFLNNGKEYRDMIFDRGEHPFFGSENILEGAVWYAGVQYEKVPLQYDIWRDCIVTIHQTGMYKIELVRELVEMFELDGHRFVSLGNEVNGLPVKGFYDMAHEGKSVSVVVRYSKSIQKQTTQTTSRFIASVSYYIVSHGKAHKVKSRRSILDCFPKHESEVRQFMKANKLEIYRNPRSSLISVAQYIDSIIDEKK